VTDPNETSNFWVHSEYAQIKAELSLRLCDRMAFTIDPLPTRRSGW
jgi:arylsulfatase